MSDGQRLFELSAREGVPVLPQDWSELHADWRATWERIAAEFKAGGAEVNATVTASLAGS